MGGMRVLRFARTIAYFQEIKMRHILLPSVLVHLNILTMSLMARWISPTGFGLPLQFPRDCRPFVAPTLVVRSSRDSFGVIYGQPSYRVHQGMRSWCSIIKQSSLLYLEIQPRLTFGFPGVPG